MNQYKILMHSLMLFYQCSMGVAMIGVSFMDNVPYWLVLSLVVVSLFDLLVMFVFQKGMDILPDA
jgi:hypothetical protein